jgi:tetratricopeptide (TPR) repeat protein
MKKQLVTVAIALITAVSFGQKKEVKKAAKEVNSKNYTEALALLNQAEGMLSVADTDTKSLFYATKAEALLETAGNDFSKMKMAAESIITAIDTDPDMANGLATLVGNLRAKLVNSAIKDQNADNYKMASDKLYQSYRISKQDTSDLYYAAGNAVNAKDYDTALSYYEQLMEMSYTGIETEYVATNKETGKVEPFSNKMQRDLMVKAGEFLNPETKISASKRGEILRNMTLIYIENKDDDKAIALMKTARQENPTDVGLIRAEADMAYKMGDKQKYSDLMEEIVATDPNNSEIYYNLGVGASELEENEKAIGYYKKAIELKPDYAAALINLGAVTLRGEAAIVDEMNNLGTSRADNARYDVLKDQRDNLYREVVSYFEKAAALNPDNAGLVRTLMNIYGQLGDDVKMNAMKVKLETMKE